MQPHYNLMNREEECEMLPLCRIRMEAFDDDPGIEPQFHTFVGSRAPWDRITDELPQYDGPWVKPREDPA